MNSAVTVRRLEGSAATSATSALADVLIDCVEGGASVSFMLPLGREKAVFFWRGVTDAVTRGERILLIAEDDSGQLLGTVQLIVAQPENQSHRADVAKLLVRRSARQRGIAQQLMSAVEDAARAVGKSVLVLDTQTGGTAERLYQRAGWQRVGVVPDYALMPDGAMCATTFFYLALPVRSPNQSAVVD